MYKVSASTGFSSGLIASVAIVLWTGAPRRIDYAFVAGNPQYPEFLGCRARSASSSSVYLSWALLWESLWAS